MTVWNLKVDLGIEKDPHPPPRHRPAEILSFFPRLLPAKDRFTQPERPAFKRRRTSNPLRTPLPLRTTPPPSSDDIEDLESLANNEDDDIVSPTALRATTESNAYDRELQALEEHTRATNAYLGAENHIGSSHQRKWHLSLDRRASDFVPITHTSPGSRIHEELRG